MNSGNDPYTKYNYWRQRFRTGPNGKVPKQALYWYYNYWYPNIGTNNGYMRNGLYVGKPRNV